MPHFLKKTLYPTALSGQRRTRGFAPIRVYRNPFTSICAHSRLFAPTGGPVLPVCVHSRLFAVPLCPFAFICVRWWSRFVHSRSFASIRGSALSIRVHLRPFAVPFPPRITRSQPIIRNSRPSKWSLPEASSVGVDFCSRFCSPLVPARGSSALEKGFHSTPCPTTGRRQFPVRPVLWASRLLRERVSLPHC